ncbi:MAG TPA: hypothetical protein VJN69_12265 [Candidatus Acidoferrales bacterium]|nr:hypothetical protein [Candidatus Acidoferrales bacterium]
MLRKALVGLIALGALASVSAAQSASTFSGTWKLNLSKSNPGDYGPSARTEVITQDGSKFTDKVTSTTQMGENDYVLTFTADGKKVTVAPDSPGANMGNLTLKDITATLDGGSLVLMEDLSYQGQVDIAAQLTYSLSPDGKTLTIADHASTSMGNFDTSLVFDKQ